MQSTRHRDLFFTRDLLLLSLYTAALVLAISACSTPSPEDIAEQADSYIAANNSEEAIRLLQGAISESPDNRLLKRKLAQTYYQSGQHSQLFSYLESGSLDARTSGRFYYLLSTVKHKDENWIGVLTHAKRGISHSQISCSGFYFLLNKMIVDANLKLENIAEAKNAMENIADSWNRLSCDGHKELAESARDLGDTFDFESLSSSDRQELNEIESLSNLADMYWINGRIVNNTHQKLDRLQEIQSEYEDGVASCKADARSRYEREWASACANEANETRRRIRVCFHNRLPTARLNYRKESLAEASARDYCEALYGSVDDSEACALPRDVANRLNARMETTIRECEQMMDIFD